MAALLLQQTRTSLPTFRALLPAFIALPRPFSWALPSIQPLLDLFPPFLLAVPKKKTSHSRKAMRSANKGLKDKHNLVHCPGCGSPKLAHHLCPECYSGLNRAWKAKDKQNGGGRHGEIPSVSMSD